MPRRLCGHEVFSEASTIPGRLLSSSLPLLFQISDILSVGSKSWGEAARGFGGVAPSQRVSTN